MANDEALLTFSPSLTGNEVLRDEGRFLLMAATSHNVTVHNRIAY